MNMNMEAWLILPVVSCVSTGIALYKGYQNNKKLNVGYIIQSMYPGFVYSYELDKRCNLQIIYPQDYRKNYGSVGFLRRKMQQNVYIPFQLNNVQINLISLTQRNKRIR